MWDGHLGRIHAVKHRIELILQEVRPVHSAPYRAGTTSRQSEKEEIDKKLEMKVIEPAHN